MSQSGITVYNTNNNLVLDNTYQNFYLTNVGRKDPDYVKKNDGTNATKYEGYLSSNMNTVRGTLTSEQRRLPYEYMLSTNNTLVAVGCSPSNLYKTYTFKNEPQTASTTGVGLQVFDANGKCIYDSNWKQLKVLFFGGSGFKLPTDKEVAIITCSSSLHYAIVPDNNTQGGSLVYETSAVLPIDGYTKIKTFCYVTNPIGGNSVNILPRQVACMVIDVTGY